MSKQNDFTEALDLIRNIIRKALGYRGDEDATQEALCWAWAEFMRRYDDEPDKHDLARSAANNGAKYANRGRRFVPTGTRRTPRAESLPEYLEARAASVEILPDCPPQVARALRLLVAGHTQIEAAKRMGVSLYRFRLILESSEKFVFFSNK